MRVPLGRSHFLKISRWFQWLWWTTDFHQWTFQSFGRMLGHVCSSQGGLSWGWYRESEPSLAPTLMPGGEWGIEGGTTTNLLSSGSMPWPCGGIIGHSNKFGLGQSKTRLGWPSGNQPGKPAESPCLHGFLPVSGSTQLLTMEVHLLPSSVLGPSSQEDGIGLPHVTLETFYFEGLYPPWFLFGFLMLFVPLNMILPSTSPRQPYPFGWHPRRPLES